MKDSIDQVEKTDSASVYDATGPICQYCGNAIYTDNPKKKFCNDEHRRLYHRNIYLNGKAKDHETFEEPLNEICQRKKLFNYLMTGPKSSLEIATYLPTCCPGTLIADLRKMGCNVNREYKGKSANGKQLNIYALLSWPESVFKRYSKESGND